MPWTEIAYELPSGEIESIVFDAVVRQNHEGSATITEHPVEEGSDISDHVRASLDRVTIEGVVTNSPIVIPPSAVGNPNIGFDGATLEKEGVAIEVPDFVRREGGNTEVPLRLNPSGLVTAALDAIFPTTATASVFAFSAGFDRVRAVDARLREIKDTGSQVLLLTSLRDYDGMLINSYTPTRDGATGDSMRFVMELRRIRIVTTETVAAPPETLPRRRRGAQRPTEATEGAGGLGVSMLRGITDSLGITEASSGG